ncbi:IS66 family transposase [Phyllobacterium salinisoli]|uniref:IS66 family transposase n=1 Tax=Phyllobacterium salinisoli TaxID=1899321 RepID=UPI00190F96F2
MALAGPKTILEVIGWAHARRKFFDPTASGKAPIAEETLRRIGELYDIEKVIRGKAARRAESCVAEKQQAQGRSP